MKKDLVAEFQVKFLNYGDDNGFASIRAYMFLHIWEIWHRLTKPATAMKCYKLFVHTQTVYQLLDRRKESFRK